jgi:aspartyl-tRNA(Asn)/glutamyl-tRNA(Gln) amidotransferase subunit C
MQLTKEEVKQIAKLSRLELSEEDIELLKNQLSSILDYVKVLQELDTSSVEPTSQVTGMQNVSREDVKKPCLTNSEALSNAPSKEKEMFKVKPIIE